METKSSQKTIITREIILDTALERAVLKVAALRSRATTGFLADVKIELDKISGQDNPHPSLKKVEDILGKYKDKI